MGFFDRIRRNEDRKEPREGIILQGIIDAYGLKQAKPYEPSLEQDWWEGHYGTLRFAVQEWGNDIHVYMGDVDEVTEIYLGRINPDRPVPGNSPQRLDRIVGPEGAELAAQFILLAHPGDEFDYPQLRLPALRDGLSRLSRTVSQIAIYENFRGLSFVAGQPYGRFDLENDLAIASGMIKALTSWVDRTDR